MLDISYRFACNMFKNTKSIRKNEQSYQSTDNLSTFTVWIEKYNDTRKSLFF